VTLRTTKFPPFLLSNGGPNQSIATTTLVFELQELKKLEIQCVIDNGTDDVAPTGSPNGVWHLYCRGSDDAEWSLIAAAETGSLSLADIKPIGDNALVNAYANFTNTPGTRAALTYEHASGTGRATIHVTVS
jgi:hypothetical protein